MAALGRLDHPNLVRAFDAGAEGSYLFLVMELLTGRDLNHLLQERGPLPPAEAAELIRQAALGLHCAHEAGLVHRDVKPSNLFVTAAGVVKVIDLGLARVTDPDQAGQRLSSKIVLGTPDYLAPEQWQRGDVDRRADLYSLGCTLVHLLTGKPPFAERGRNWLQLLDAHRHAPPPDLTALRPGVPQGLADLIVRLLAKDPADRPATALEVVAALAPLATGVGLPTDVTQRLTPPPPGLAPPAPPPRPPRRLLALLGIGVAALAGLALWFATRPPEGAPSTPAAASPTAAAPAVLTAVRTLKTHRGGVLALAYSPDGKVLASGGKDQTIYLHNTATWKASPPLTGHPSDVIGLAFRPDGTRLASVTSGDDQCAIRLWDVATGQAAGTLGNPGRGQFAVAYSPDGQALACGGWDRVLRVFDVATGRERFPPPVVTPRLIRGLAFAPGGGMVATGGNGRTRLWDAATGAEIRSDLPVDLNPTFLPGGQELVGWTYVEGRVTICAVPSGEVRLTWPAHASEIEGLAVSPGGRFLTSVGKDGLAKVWATADGREVATLKGHRGSVYVAAFSPDARQVATGGAGDFTVQIWDLPAECWVR
jgi:DNA-binding beta-propeller fold protein YncE